MSDQNEVNEQNEATFTPVTVSDIDPTTGTAYTEESAAAYNDAQAPAEHKGTKRPKKLSKGIEGTVVKITVLGAENGEMTFDTAELPEEIQKELIPFGAGHKLGDSAAGREGAEAVEAINKVWEGLMKGDWTVRAPAAPKVSIADIKTSLANMSEDEAEKAKALLASMGFKL